MSRLSERITVDDKICNGQPTIRGYRVTVQTLLEFIFAGTSSKEILRQYPFLEEKDLAACKEFALHLMKNRYSVTRTAA